MLRVEHIRLRADPALVRRALGGAAGARVGEGPGERVVLGWEGGLDAHTQRIAGMDLLPELLSTCEKAGLKVGFYGSTEKILERTKMHLQNKFPQLDCPLFFSPPFRNLTETEELEIIQMINHSGIHLLFVVLGCPKQEKWMARMNGKVKGVMVGIGGALPVLIGSQKRAPKWMQEYGLEWFFRLQIGRAHV